VLVLGAEKDRGPVINWDRGVTRAISHHFTAKEFTCSCGVCKLQRIDEQLLAKLEAVREELGAPITVTSGFRCALRQSQLTKQGLETAKGLSTHELGQAADIRAPDISKLLEICEKQFKAIGVAKTFLHVDLRSDTTRRWYYK
jgi:uncharacterized protein YcbK (DUF882 family)